MCCEPCGSDLPAVSECDECGAELDKHGEPLDVCGYSPYDDKCDKCGANPCTDYC